MLETISLQGEAAVISPEILAKAARAGFTITELPVSHYPRHAGKPTGANVRVIARSLTGLMRLRWQLGVITGTRRRSMSVRDDRER